VIALISVADSILGHICLGVTQVLNNQQEEGTAND
jgi:hypothetical protein